MADLLTVDQLARMLDMHPRTIRRYRMNKNIQSFFEKIYITIKTRLA